MNQSKKFLAAAGLLAMGLAAHSVSAADAAKEASGKTEKCYGIAKSGKNDCGAKDGSHSCAGQAKTSGDANEWIALPVGLCDRIVGGVKGS